MPLENNNEFEIILKSVNINIRNSYLIKLTMYTAFGIGLLLRLFFRQTGCTPTPKETDIQPHGKLFLIRHALSMQMSQLFESLHCEMNTQKSIYTQTSQGKNAKHD